MTAEVDPMAGLRQQLNNQLVDNILAPAGGADAAAAGSPDVASLGPSSPDDGSFQVTLGPRAAQWVRDQMVRTGADKRLDATIGRMTGGQFSPDQVHMLEDRALHNASVFDPLRLAGVEEGPPVVLNPQQKAVIDRLMSQMGSDPLGQAAQSAYQGAWKHGQIKLGGH